MLHQWQKAANCAGLKMHRRVDGDDRGAFGDAVALQDTLAEPLGPNPAGLLAHRLSAREYIAQRIEIIGMGGAGIDVARLAVVHDGIERVEIGGCVDRRLIDRRDERRGLAQGCFFRHE